MLPITVIVLLLLKLLLFYFFSSDSVYFQISPKKRLALCSKKQLSPRSQPREWVVLQETLSTSSPPRLEGKK